MRIFTQHTTEYLYCTTCRYAQVLEERDDLGNITAEYFIGNDLISREDGAQELSYLYDGHGSVRKLINEYGGVPAQYSYDAYGILLESSGPSSEDNDFRYSGEQFDPHLDQYYLRARYYNQTVGRFSSMDTWAGSLSNPLSLNKYNYTESNPVMGRDPSGRDTILAMMAGVDAWGQHFLGAISVSTCSSCPQVTKDGGRVFLSPQMAAEDAKEYVLRNYPKNSGRSEFFAEIYKTDMNKECYSYYKPYTGDGYDDTHSDDSWKTSGYVDSVRFITPRSYKSIGYWHSHPIPQPDAFINILHLKNVVEGHKKDGWGWYRGEDYKSDGVHNFSSDDIGLLDRFSDDQRKKYVFMNVFNANISYYGGAPYAYPMNTYIRNY